VSDLLNPIGLPLGENLFCEFFNNAMPLPPSSESYYVESQDNTVNYVNESGAFYVRS
jgi:hypothetical protein